MYRIFYWNHNNVDGTTILIRLFIIHQLVLYGVGGNDLPRIIKIPKDFVFASTMYDPITFNIKMSPSDVKFLLLVRESDSYQTLKNEFQTLYNSSKDFSSIGSFTADPLAIKITSHVNMHLNHLSVNITLIHWFQLMSQPMHVRVMTYAASILSAPIRIQVYHLSKFTEKGNEHVEFVMGNVAQILCSLPIAKPSPPIIRFKHNSNFIDISNSSRYKLVEFPPLYNKVALLIRNVMEDDSGKYVCVATLPNTILQQDSSKITHLKVKRPTHNIPTRFRLSSHYNFDDNKNIDVKVPEGAKLVLYCVIESAPIEEINWFWAKNDRKYELDSHFGTLTINNVNARDNGHISCMNNEDKTFNVHVYQKPKLVMRPKEISLKNHNKRLIIKCQFTSTDSSQTIIHWLFNGVPVAENNEIEMTNNSLIIQKFTQYNQGVYQCWTEYKNQWLSDYNFLQFPRPNRDKVRSEHIKKNVYFDPGTPLDIRCQIPAHFNSHNTTATWTKEHSKKEISSSSNKFIKFVDIENNQFVLKIKNPNIRLENDNLLCKIFSKDKPNAPIRTVQFKLQLNKSLKQNQAPELPESVQEPITFFTISKPSAKLVQSFLLAVNLSWSLNVSLPDINQSKIMNHYRVEYKQGSPKYRPIRWRSSAPIIEWTNATLIDKSFNKPPCLIHSSQILKPQFWYSFRVVGIPDIKYVQMKVSKDKNNFSRNFFNTIRSPWSDSVNFEHILPFRPRITNVTILSSTSASIAWVYGPVDYQSERNIEFKILYRVLPSDMANENVRSINEQIYDLLYLQDYDNSNPSVDKIDTVTKISAHNSDIYLLNISNLKSSTQYIVALYAIHRPNSGISRMYTALSDPYLMDTISSKDENKEINGNHNYNNPKNQTILHSNYFRNKILYLVLGSLAGILFVIALFMFIMCLWYQIRYHNKKRQNLSSTSSAKTSNANTFAPIGARNQIPNNSVFIASSNIVSPQGVSPWTKANRFPPPSAEFPHLYLAQHLSLWSPNHLAQFNLPSNLHDPSVDETKTNKPSLSPTTLSTPSPKSNIDLEINNLDGSIEDSQEESVRLLDYQSHSSGFKREDQCTLNNAFSVKSEGRERPKEPDASSDNTRSISHYPFSPSALELYSNKKKSKVCSTNRKDLSNIKLHLKQPKLQNSNYFLPIRSRLSCFFPSAPSGESPPPYTPVIASLCKENTLNHCNRMKKDETFAEHPFLTTDHAKNGLNNNYGNGSFKYRYSPANNFNNPKLPSKFIFDPIHDLQPHEDSRSNSTAASARQFLFSLYPDGVRPCINLDLDKQGVNSQTNL